MELFCFVFIIKKLYNFGKENSGNRGGIVQNPITLCDKYFKFCVFFKSFSAVPLAIPL